MTLIMNNKGRTRGLTRPGPWPGGFVKFVEMAESGVSRAGGITWTSLARNTSRNGRARSGQAVGLVDFVDVDSGSVSEVGTSSGTRRIHKQWRAKVF